MNGTPNRLSAAFDASKSDPTFEAVSGMAKAGVDTSSGWLISEALRLSVRGLNASLYACDSREFLKWLGLINAIVGVNCGHQVEMELDA